MKLSIRKMFAMLLALALLLSSIHTSPASASPAVRDGVFQVPFEYLKDGSDQASVADSFMIKDSGKLIIEDGVAIFEHEVRKLDYSTFAFFGTRNEGAAKAVISVSGSGETVSGQAGYTQAAVSDSDDANNMVIRLSIPNVYVKPDILMHIYDVENIYNQTPFYNHWYHAQLDLDLTGIDLTPLPGDNGGGDGGEVGDVTLEMFNARVTVGESIYEAASEGAADGDYPVGSKSELHNKISYAKSIVSESPQNQVLLEAAYHILDQAIKKFESLEIVVDKAPLGEWIAEAEAWLETAREAGFAESGRTAHPVNDLIPISVGEFPVATVPSDPSLLTSAVSKVRSHVDLAKTIVNNPEATNLEVATVYQQAINDFVWSELNKQKVVASTTDIYVFESLTSTVYDPNFAPEIKRSAVLLKSEVSPQTYANITFDKLEDEHLVVQPNTSGTGSYARNYTKITKPVTLSSSESSTVYQTLIRQGEPWLGLWKLKYPITEGPLNQYGEPTFLDTEETKEVLISFNVSEHQALLELIEEAQTLYEQSETTEGNELGQYPEAVRERLAAAITTAKVTGDNYASTRPNLQSATAALTSAIAVFESGIVRNLHFSAAHASDSAFSRMEEYFAKPAVSKGNADGTLQMSMTVLNSRSVPEIKIMQGGSFVDVTPVSEDEAGNTRVVSFNVPSLTALLEAQVRTVVPAQNYDRTHSIRFNFNNADNRNLYSLIKEAEASHAAAVVGTSPGQYPEFAKTAFKSAIVQAHAEAVRVPAVAADTASALLLLQRAINTFNSSVVATPGGPGNPSNPGNPGNPSNPGPQYPADGNYFMDFTVLKKNTSNSSVMDQYVFKKALVRVSGGSKTVSFTLKQSNEITGFTLNGGSGSVSGQSSSTNTRVVTFTFSDLSVKIPGWVSVYWDLSATIPGFIYDEQYDIDFQFQESTASYAGENPTVPGGSGNGGLPPGLDPSEVGGGTPVDEDNDPEEEENDVSEEEANPPGPSVKFSDTGSHWAKKTIEQAVELGIVKGFDDGSFRPDDTVTRGEFAVMISRALGLEGEGDSDSLQDFGSIPNWAQSHVARVVTAGLISGFEDATFRSGGQLTRAQLAVIIARTAGLELNDDAAATFADTSDIPAWAQKEVAAAVEAGLIQGKDGNRFDPNATATRAEALTLIIRLLTHLE